MQKDISYIKDLTIYYFNKSGGGILRKEVNSQIDLNDILLIAICRRVFGDGDFDFLFLVDKNLKQYALDYRSLGLPNIQKIFKLLKLESNFEFGEEFDFKYMDKIVFPQKFTNEKLFQYQRNLFARNINFIKHLLRIKHWSKGELNQEILKYLKAQSPNFKTSS